MWRSKGPFPIAQLDFCFFLYLVPFKKRKPERTKVMPFPTMVLRNCLRRRITLELKNGEGYSGVVKKCDMWMNIDLTGVIKTSPDGDEFFSAPEALIRGSSIRTISMEPEALEGPAARPNQKRKKIGAPEKKQSSSVANAAKKKLEKVSGFGKASGANSGGGRGGRGEGRGRGGRGRGGGRGRSRGGGDDGKSSSRGKRNRDD